MLRTLQMLRHKLQNAMRVRSIARSLALYRRGEVRRDGLELVSFVNTLKICWRAREVHPWDRHLSQEQRMHTFNEQFVSDTEAAVVRLFDAMPQVDTIELCVFDPLSEKPLVEGTVSRSTLQNVLSLNLQSARMRLLQLGLQCFLPETMERARCQHPCGQ